MQKPFTRYSQCGHLTLLFGSFVIMFSLSSTALTTFGVNKPQIPIAPPTQMPKGKECNSNAECIGIADTSCVKGYSDSLQSRCLCGDDLAPINGYCSTKLKGLRHQCKRTEDCEDNLICRENNQTKTTILGNFAKGNREKLCFCDEEIGYMENIIENHCNAAVNFVTSVLPSYIFAIAFYYFFTQKFLTY